MKYFNFSEIEQDALFRVLFHVWSLEYAQFMGLPQIIATAEIFILIGHCEIFWQL